MIMQNNDNAQKYFLSTVKSAIIIQKYLIIEPPEK